jgi:hypothetical protein
LTKVKKQLPEEPIFLLDDTDIAKPYGKAFEDLCRIHDGSTKEIVNGYQVCECVVLSEKEKQPLSIYSEVYSTLSDGFSSKNTYTLESIKRAREVAECKTHWMILDRGYDSNSIIEELDKEKTRFVLRINDKRQFLFKGKKKSVGKVATNRKGKIRMTLRALLLRKNVPLFITPL